MFSSEDDGVITGMVPSHCHSVSQCGQPGWWSRKQLIGKGPVVMFRLSRSIEKEVGGSGAECSEECELLAAHKCVYSPIALLGVCPSSLCYGARLKEGHNTRTSQNLRSTCNHVFLMQKNNSSNPRFHETYLYTTNDSMKILKI